MTTHIFISMLHWLQKLHYSQFTLLLLPLFLISFAIGGESFTNQILSRSYNTTSKLQADKQTVKAQFAANVLVTAVEVEKKRESTVVEYQTENSVLKKVRFVLPVTEVNTAKTIIAQEMGQTQAKDVLQIGRKMQVRSAFKVLGILAEIEKKRGVTLVTVNTASSTLQNLEFEYPVTDLPIIKATLIQQLGLSKEDIARFVSYRIKN
ncbi:MAG: hypothetical protein KME29_12985 [Calothrix sp. FI2-JRJ7]|jgi:hypothetical protein|nr:hypothetical protein [Calothrix sp. FI2-JRJ7]